MKKLFYWTFSFFLSDDSYKTKMSLNANEIYFLENGRCRGAWLVTSAVRRQQDGGGQRPETDGGQGEAGAEEGLCPLPGLAASPSPLVPLPPGPRQVPQPQSPSWGWRPSHTRGARRLQSGSELRKPKARQLTKSRPRLPPSATQGPLAPRSSSL